MSETQPPGPLPTESPQPAPGAPGANNSEVVAAPSPWLRGQLGELNQWSTDQYSSLGLGKKYNQAAHTSSGLIEAPQSPSARHTDPAESIQFHPLAVTVDKPKPTFMDKVRGVLGQQAYAAGYARLAAHRYRREIMTPEQRTELADRKRACAGLGLIAVAAAGTYAMVKYDLPPMAPLGVTSGRPRRSDRFVSPNVARSGTLVPPDRHETYLRRAERIIRRKRF